MPRRAGSDGVVTRRHIMKAAVRLFAEHGYAGVSVRDIASATGVRPSSLYNHFSGKEQILAAVYEEMGERLLGPPVRDEQIDAVLDTLSASAFFHHAFDRYLDAMTDAYAVDCWRIMITEQFRDDRARSLLHADFGNRLRENTERAIARM